MPMSGMISIPGEVIMAISAIFAALSQLLLKLSAGRTYKSSIGEYLNIRVISAYVLLGLSMLMNTYAFQTVDYKWGPVIASTSYVYIMLLSYFVLKERMSTKKIIGSLLIVLGIIIF
ncbi:MAG: EamA family transporter [Fastidiosipilaceae bacterium]|jgi:drug/metabolite transporter (DMT)-like permease